MSADLLVVAPYRAMPAESASHKRLGPFDWVEAARMLRISVAESCRCETVILSDDETPVGTSPVLRFPTSEPKLMLWILEVSLAYLHSDAFVCDTVFASPDTIVRGDLRRYFRGDLTLLTRSNPKYAARPILNALQFWPVRSRDALIEFYTQALAIARALPEDAQRWGADSEALRVLIAPIELGLSLRGGLRLACLEASTVLYPIQSSMVTRLQTKRRLAPHPAPVVDFKGQRKQWMRMYFEALYGVAV